VAQDGGGGRRGGGGLIEDGVCREQKQSWRRMEAWVCLGERMDKWMNGWGLVWSGVRPGGWAGVRGEGLVQPERATQCQERKCVVFLEGRHFCISPPNTPRFQVPGSYVRMFVRQQRLIGDERPAETSAVSDPSHPARHQNVRRSVQNNTPALKLPQRPKK